MNLNLNDTRIHDIIVGLYNPSDVEFTPDYDTVALSFDIAGAPVTTVIERTCPPAESMDISTKTQVYYSVPPIDLSEDDPVFENTWNGGEPDTSRYFHFLLQDLVNSIGRTDIDPRLVFHHIESGQEYETTVGEGSLHHGVPHSAPEPLASCSTSEDSPGFAVGVDFCGRRIWKYALPNMGHNIIAITDAPPNEFVGGSPPTVFTDEASTITTQTGNNNLRWDSLADGEYNRLNDSSIVGSDQMDKCTVNGVQLMTQNDNYAGGVDTSSDPRTTLSDFENGVSVTDDGPDTSALSLQLLH